MHRHVKHGVVLLKDVLRAIAMVHLQSADHVSANIQNIWNDALQMLLKSELNTVNTRAQRSASQPGQARGKKKGAARQNPG